MMRRLLYVFIPLLLLCSPAPAFAADPFRVCDLKVDGNVGYYVAEDLNGDGLKDLVVFHTKEEKGRKERWLSIFYQTAANFPSVAGFPSDPHRTFRVEGRAVVFDVGDALPVPGKEIAFLARDGLYAYAVGNTPSPPLGEREGGGSRPHGSDRLGGGGEGSPQKVLDVPSIFQVPNPSWLADFDFILDLNGDGVDEVLIPQLDRYAIYAKDAEGRLKLIGAIDLGLVPSVRGLPAGREAVGFGVRAGLATPKFLTLDFNGDKKTDLLAVYTDSLCAFFQRSDRTFNGPPDRVVDVRFDRIATGTETIRAAPDDGDRDEHTYVTKVIDLDGDGRIDLVALKISTQNGVLRPDTQVQVYYGRNTGDRGLFPKSPDQVLKVDGTQVLTDVVDLDGDGKMDLIVPSIKLGIAQIIQVLISRTLDVDAYLYLMRKDGRYPASASYKRSFPVQFDFKGHHSQPVYEVEDLNGDGRLDVLTSADATELKGFYGDPVRIFDRKPGFRFQVKLPRNGEWVKAMHLNADRRADVVITYEKQDEEEGENLRGLVRVLLSNVP